MLQMKSIILLLLFPSLVLSSQFLDIPLTNSSGLFYYKIGNAKISNTELVLITHINITYLYEAKNLLLNFYAKSRNLCFAATKGAKERNHVTLHCEQSLANIEKEFKMIESKEEILHDLVGLTPEPRKRRGLINGLSHVLKWLIGTPDADDASYFSDSIESLVNSNKQTQTLLKSQIQIISSTIKNFNDSVRSIKALEKDMNWDINVMNNFMNNTDQRLSRLDIENTITRHITSLLALCMRISEDYSKYIEILNLGNNNIISPYLITPNNLVAELLSYKGEFELVLIPTNQNLPTIYKLMKLEGMSTKGLIIFALKFPLVKRNSFDLFNLIPLPIQHHNMSLFSFIQPRNPYLLLSQSRTQFSFLPGLSDCGRYLDDRYVCTGVHITQTTEKTTCEVQLLAPHTESIPEDCETKTVRAEIETWKYLDNNQWIYVLQKPTTLTVLCEGNMSYAQDVVLKRTGILQLQGSCKGYTPLYSLEPTEHINKNVTHQIPSISITESDCCQVSSDTLKLKSDTLKPIKLTNVDLADLKYASKKLDEFDEIITKQLNEPFIVRHTTWYNVAIGIICAVLFLALCRSCYRQGSWLRKLWHCIHGPARTQQQQPTAPVDFGAYQGPPAYHDIQDPESPTTSSSPPDQEIVLTPTRYNLRQTKARLTKPRTSTTPL